MIAPLKPPASVWFRTFVHRPAAELRLVCFPHAGGTAAGFRGWGEQLPPSIEVVAVQYPGRQDRFGEPPAPDMATLADEITRSLLPLLDRPVAFFGHSMGGTVAYEVARRLPRELRPALVRLFASARRGPAECRPLEPRYRGVEGLVTYVRELGGMGAALLDDPDLREIVIPPLLGDFHIVDTYRHVPGRPLSCPVTAVVGSHDPSNTRAEGEQWAQYTTADFEVRELPGGHFYTETATAELMALLTEKLAPAQALRS